MGVLIDGTIEDLATSIILIEVKPKGGKKSLDYILNSRHIKEEDIKKACQKVANSMVKKRFLNYEQNGVYVFSKELGLDEKEYYYWKEATVSDQFMHYPIN